MEDMRAVLNVMYKNDFMCTIDLKDAYLMVPVCQQHRKFFRFCFLRTLYQFRALPFGFNRSPYEFTKIMKAPINYLRKRGIRCVIYLDDLIIFGETKEKCQNNTNMAIKLLQELGFVINFVKSQTSPSQFCRFLGFLLDSKSMEITLTQEKRTKIKNLVSGLLNKKNCSIETLASLTGSLVSSCLAVKYGWLFYKYLERDKMLALARFDNDYKQIISLSEDSIEELRWWNENIMKTKNQIRFLDFDKEIFTDASKIAWGAVYREKKAKGPWTEEERLLHINLLELKAAFFGLKTFCANDRSKQILLRIDNSTAIAYINKFGGVKFPALHKIAKDIWSWCMERDLWIFAEYVASNDNIADIESRTPNIDTEWEIADKAFQKIKRKFGEPQIDLFASRINSKCAQFCSWQRDPEAVTINAFTFNWNGSFFYAFPPFSLIHKVIRKIKYDRARGIVIVPFWTSQPWWVEFTEILVSEKLVFGPDKDLLLSPCRARQHPLAGSLTLIAGVLSGDTSRKRAIATES